MFNCYAEGHKTECCYADCHYFESVSQRVCLANYFWSSLVKNDSRLDCLAI